MVKKRLVSGEPCQKCAHAEEQLRRRGLWDRIDKVVWAVEGEDDSLGWELARRHQVEAAPFFIVGGEDSVAIYTSTLALIREVLQRAPAGGNNHRATSSSGDEKTSVDEVRARLEDAEPAAIVRWALETYGRDTAIAFSGAEDVVLIHMAAESGLPFTAITIDTGRLHPETYEFIDWVRERYQVDLVVTAPDRVELESLVRDKGLFSFYRDGHAECCGVRKVKPLRRALVGRPAWITGQRRDQSETREVLAVVHSDIHLAEPGSELVKINPLASWTADRVWEFIHDQDVPHNPLHGRGFASIGCAPCTRPILPGQGPRDGRWWWESSDKKECGLHVQTHEPSTDAP